MKHFLLYGHGGSYNHGAEAIVRTTVQMIRSKYLGAHIALSSHFPEQDREFALNADTIYGSDKVAWELEKKAVNRREKRELARAMFAEALSKIDKDVTCLSVGGDTFCYDNWHRLAVFQQRAAQVGAKTILWGCSVEPSAITSDMLEVLHLYDSIVARESITFDALSEHGLSDKLFLAPDSAFNLQSAPGALPDSLIPERTIGINISPLVIRLESRKGILLENVKLLIRHITAQIGYDVMLIPHVLMPADNDLELLSELWNGLSEKEKERTVLFDGNRSAAEYKFAISRCEMIVCARTHVSIAAYSYGIPALVLGYSAKAQGIARDLGMAEYVLDAMEIKEDSTLTNAFMNLHGNHNCIRAHLRSIMPAYKANISKIYEIL